VYLAYPARERGVRAVVDALAAFAGGSFVRFGLRTLRHRAAAVTRVLALLLIPWTIAMAVTDTARWFPSAPIKAAWIGADIALFALLMSLAARWRRGLATALSTAAAADFTLGCVQAVAYNGPRARGVIDWIAVVLALAAPLSAAAFLWWSRGRATLYDVHRDRDSIRAPRN
jgi:phosphatidylglycerol lysyltransferase